MFAPSASSCKTAYQASGSEAPACAGLPCSQQRYRMYPEGQRSRPRILRSKARHQGPQPGGGHQDQTRRPRISPLVRMPHPALYCRPPPPAHKVSPGLKKGASRVVARLSSGSHFPSQLSRPPTWFGDVLTDGMIARLFSRSRRFSIFVQLEEDRISPLSLSCNNASGIFARAVRGFGYFDSVGDALDRELDCV